MFCEPVMLGNTIEDRTQAGESTAQRARGTVGAETKESGEQKPRHY